jgi:hypothetical protein|tara:strand:- start:211 stop:1275 length:1065 start_codon:yes stop_codon:yes gene_type:complete
MAKINVRSPYFVNIATTNLTSAKIELIIYSGAVNTSWQGSPQYTLVSTAIDAKVNFEIAELIKDYITALFDGAFPSTPVTTSEATTIYVDYRITETTTTATTVLTPVYGNRAFYGYGFFEDGANPQLAVATLQSNLSILRNNDEVFTIPVDNTNIGKVEFLLNGAVVNTQSPLSSPDIEDQIQYVQNLNSGSKFNCDQVKIFQSNPALTVTVDIIKYEKCKYTPIQLTFINRFGAYQEIWMFANSKLTLNTNKEKYKSNILTNGTYSTNDAQIKLLTKNGNQQLTLNSDFYPESYNVVFEELFLSEKVWIYYGGQTLGINIDSKAFNYKTSLTDGLINYTIDVSFAFDSINNIR